MTDCASQTEVSKLAKGGYVVIQGQPCKIVEISTHGDKVNISALGIFSGEKLTENLTVAQIVDVPHVQRKDLQILNIEGGAITLMDQIGESMNTEFTGEGDLQKEIQTKFDNGEAFYVTVVSAMGKNMLVGTKVITT